MGDLIASRVGSGFVVVRAKFPRSYLYSPCILSTIPEYIMGTEEYFESPGHAICALDNIHTPSDPP
jgi:hypothetical protein